MNKNENNWFYRNRTFLFGFTAVLIVLYIVISMLVPHQTPVAWSGEATEYAVNDEDFAEVHTVALEGTLTSSVIGGTRFDAPSEIVDIIMGCIVLCIAISSLLRMMISSNKKNKGGV